MHKPSVLSGGAFAVVVLCGAGCSSPPVELGGLSGFHSIDLATTRSTVAFTFGLGTHPACLEPDRVAFDNIDVDFSVDGQGEPGFLSAGSCGTASANGAFSSSITPRDGSITVSGADGDARYVGQNLITRRRAIIVEGPATDRGDTITLRYEPATDLLNDDDMFVSLVSSTETVLRLVPGATAAANEFQVTIPAAARVGDNILQVSVGFEVPTLSCEGFAECLVTGTSREDQPIRIR